MTADETAGLTQLESSTEPLRHSVSPSVSDFTGISSAANFLASLTRLHAAGIVDGLALNEAGGGVPNAWRLTRLGELHCQSQAIVTGAPAITSLTPSTKSIAAAAGAPVSVSIAGTGFRGHQHVEVNGVRVPAVYTNKTTWVASYTLPLAAITVQFTVVDPQTGQTSANSPFVVTA